MRPLQLGVQTEPSSSARRQPSSEQLCQPGARTVRGRHCSPVVGIGGVGRHKLNRLLGQALQERVHTACCLSFLCVSRTAGMPPPVAIN